MTVNAHAFPSLNLVLNNLAGNCVVGTSALNVALTSSSTPNCLGGAAPQTMNATIEAMTTWTSIKSNGGTNTLTEVANGSGYATGGLVLTAASLASADSFAGTAAYTSLTYSGTIQWTAATFTATQAVWYFLTAPTQGICFWDFGGGQSCSSGTFTLTLGTGANSVANCLVQYTIS